MTRSGQNPGPGAGRDLRRAEARGAAAEEPDSSTTATFPAATGTTAPNGGAGSNGGAGARGGSGSSGAPAVPTDSRTPVPRTIGSALRSAASRTEIVPPTPPVDNPARGSFAAQPGGLPPRPGAAPTGPGGPGLAGPGHGGPGQAGPGVAGAATGMLGRDTSSPAGGRRPSQARPARRAQLTLRRVNVWSVFKFSCILSIVLFLVWIIGVGVLYGVVDAAGVIKSVNSAVGQVNPTSGTTVKVGQVFGVAAIIGAVNIVLFIALTTLFGVIYNLCADLVGGVEVTLSERE